VDGEGKRSISCVVSSRINMKPFPFHSAMMFSLEVPSRTIAWKMREAMRMKPGVLLLVSLLSLYGAAMLISGRVLSQKRESPVGNSSTLCPQKGQTILGVMDTTERTCFLHWRD